MPTPTSEKPREISEKAALSGRLQRIASALFLGLAGLASGPAAADLSYEEGVARDPDSNVVLYREQHLVRRVDGAPSERLVVYRCPDGTAFARKRVDYRDSRQAPAFTFEDARDGYGEGLRRRGQAARVWVREGRDQTERSAPLAAANLLVADAGFDEFIRRQWQPLLAGESVALRFALPARLESLGFRLKRVGSAQVAGETAELFRLKLGGLLGWVAPHIDVAYGRESRRLLRFEGLSNLRDDDGDSQLSARIDFPRAAKAAAEPQWQAFEALTLSACRVRG